MIKLIIVMILSALAVVWVFPEWSKERDKRLATRSYFACWRARETMLFSDLYYYHLKSHAGIDLAIARALKQKKNFNENKFMKG